MLQTRVHDSIGDIPAADWNQPECAALLGDGAAAALLTPHPADSTLMHFLHETWSEHIDTCRVNGGATLLPSYDYTSNRKADYLFQMNGPAVFKAALQKLSPMVNQLIDASEHDRSQLHVIPHQASPKANKMVCHTMKMNRDRFYGGIAEHGNLAAAGIPLVLDRCRKETRILRDEVVMLLGTSAGYSQAALIFQM